MQGADELDHVSVTGHVFGTFNHLGPVHALVPPTGLVRRDLVGQKLRKTLGGVHDEAHAHFEFEEAEFGVLVEKIEPGKDGQEDGTVDRVHEKKVEFGGLCGILARTRHPCDHVDHLGRAELDLVFAHRPVEGV